MTQTERLEYLITCLIKEQPEYEEISIPTEIEEKKRLLRSLMNVRPAVPISREFLRIQDEYLKNELTLPLPYHSPHTRVHPSYFHTL